MIKNVRHLFRATLAVALTALLVAGSLGTWEVGGQHDRHELARLTDGMKTRCVGRFLIDMPAEAQVEFGQATIDGFNIATFVETPEEFKKRLAAREAEIRAKPDQQGRNKNLESEKQVDSDHGIIGKVFVHSRMVHEGTRANGLELERYRNEGVAIEALVHGGGISIDLGSDYYDPDQIWRLPQLVAQLVPNPDNKIPSQSGFCMDRVYFCEPLTADQGEQIMMFGGVPKHPDVQFMLILAEGLKPHPHGILERSADSTGALSLWQRMRISKMRAAPREIAGLPGEELVRTFAEGNGARVYSFWYEAAGTEHNVLIPHLLFKMDTGKSNNGPVPSSLSKDAALGLWDRILASVRLHNTRSNSPYAR